MVITITKPGTERYNGIHYYGSAFDKGYEELAFVDGTLTSITHNVPRDSVAWMMREGRRRGLEVELYKDFT